MTEIWNGTILVMFVALFCDGDITPSFLAANKQIRPTFLFQNANISALIIGRSLSLSFCFRYKIKKPLDRIGLLYVQTIIKAKPSEGKRT